LPYNIAAPPGAVFLPGHFAELAVVRRGIVFATEPTPTGMPVKIQSVSRPLEKLNNEKVHSMLYTIAVILIVLWLLGLVTSYTMGGFVHILLVVALIMIVVNVLSGRRGA
jgi:hypothetical protein